MRATTWVSTGLGGRYRLDRLVARGTTVDVYAARDRHEQRVVAVKWVRADLAPSEHPLCRLDADELRRLSHPGLVRERDHGVEDGRPFLVMDFAGPGTLRTAWEGGPLPCDMVASIGRQLALTLTYLHDDELVHRYVTADRVLVDALTRQPDLRVRLDCSPWVPTRPPSDADLAPELRRGGDATVAGDVWSLGSLLLDCLIGVHEDGCRDPDMVRLERHASLADLAEPWRTLLPTMLDERPAYRPTAGQVAAVLGAARPRSVVHPVPAVVVARRPSASRASRSRTRALVLVAAATVVLVLVGMRVGRAEEAAADRSDASPQRGVDRVVDVPPTAPVTTPVTTTRVTTTSRTTSTTTTNRPTTSAGVRAVATVTGPTRPGRSATGPAPMPAPTPAPTSAQRGHEQPQGRAVGHAHAPGSPASAQPHGRALGHGTAHGHSGAVHPRG